MTTENDLIRPLLVKAREEGQVELIVVADQYPSLMKPKDGGGLEHTVLDSHEPISNNSIATYLNDLNVELERGYAEGYTDDRKAQFFARSDRMGRLTILFHLLSRPAQTTSA